MDELGTDNPLDGSVGHADDAGTGAPPAASPGGPTDTENGHDDSAGPVGLGQADQLVALASENFTLFHDPQGVPWAAKGDEGLAIHAVESTGFRRELQRLFRDAAGRVPNAVALNTAIHAIGAEAVIAGPMRPVHLRVGSMNNTLLVDPGDSSHVIEISDGNWRIRRSSPVMFRRPATADSLPLPLAQGWLESDLRPFINTEDDEDFKLIVGYLVGALNPTGPYPVLVLQGEQGSAKSTASRVIKALVDPTQPAVRSLPRSERDLAVAATSNWLLAFDNLGGLPPWMSDAFCRLSTGGGFGTRALYTNDEEQVFDLMRPLVLNGLDAIVTRQDLMDRALLVRLPEIDPESRQPEATFWEKFHAAQEPLLGALYAAAASAHQGQSEIDLPELPRLADFARWVTAAEPALGWPPGSFIAAMEASRSRSLRLSLDASPVAAKIVLLMEVENNDWTGTPSELLVRLEMFTDDRTRYGRGWPRGANPLSRQLTLLAPALREVGISIDRRHSKQNWLTITREVA